MLIAERKQFPHAYCQLLLIDIVHKDRLLISIPVMQRFPTGKYLGCCVMLWGAMVAVTCSCKSYRSLMAVRFLLGAFESAISPSLILITSMWYKRNEVGLVPASTATR